MIYSTIRGASPEYIGRLREAVRQNNPKMLSTFDDCVQRASTGRFDDGYFKWEQNPTATGSSWSAIERHPIPTPIPTPSLPAPGAGTPEEAAAAIAKALGMIAAGAFISGAKVIAMSITVAERFAGAARIMAHTVTLGEQPVGADTITRVSVSHGSHGGLLRRQRSPSWACKVFQPRTGRPNKTLHLPRPHYWFRATSSSCSGPGR